MQLQPVRTVDRDDEQIRLRRTGDRLDPAVQDPVDDVDRESGRITTVLALWAGLSAFG